MTTDFPTLPTGPLPHLAMDYARLRAEGLRMLGDLAGQQWTDFNTHDPGITILEQLCYAISDLGYRTNFPMADLLADSPADGLPGPAEILTCEPVTRSDLRKRVLDVGGVGNAWVEDPSDPAIAFFYHVGSGELRLQADASEAEAQPIMLRGLHRVVLQTTDQLSADAALEQVATRIHQGRLLGEDYELALLGSFEVWLRANIEVGPIEDPVAVLADIVERIEDYLAPRARFTSLAEGRAQGRRIDQLFEGPRLDHGFIEHLPQPRHSVYVSDLLHAITDVPQVRALRSLELSSSANAARATWALDVPPGQVAKLAPSSELILLRAGLPVRVDRSEVRALLERRRVERASGAIDMRELAPPVGRPRALARYRSIRRQLPATYGVGPLGLADSAPAARRAQARQLEAYLLIFDQLLANEFAQLAHAHELLSPDQGGLATYFAQVVDDPPLAFQHLLRGEGQGQREWLESVIEPGDPLERRKRFLAHLLARFGEQLGDHNQIAHALAANEDPDAQLVRDRQTFLRNYPTLSGARGSGYDLREGEADSVLEQRLRLKLGLTDDQRFVAVEHVLLRPLPEDSAQLVEEGEEQVPLLAGVEMPDPFSLQVSYVFQDRAQPDPAFEELVAQTILAESPAHLTTHLRWFGANDGVDHWAAFAAAWTEFKRCHRAYRAARLQATSVDTLIQLQARDARDRVIDLLEFGRTYPLRDIPLPQHVIVAPGTPTQITLEYSQLGVDYELRHRDTGNQIMLAGKPIVAAGTGGPLVLPTPPIDDDISYRVLAVKREGADQLELRRAAWLRGIVRVEEGVDPTLVAQIKLPLLDPRIDAPKPSDARLADYGVNVEVEILLSQEGVSYELINHAKPDQKLSTPVVGTSGTIVLSYPTVKEDIDLRVRGSKSVGDPQNPEIRTAVLDLILPLRVRANPAIAAVLNPGIVVHAGSSSLDLSSTQKSASYRVWQRAIRDSEFVFAQPPAVATIDVVDDKRTIRVARPSKPATWTDLPGFTPRLDAQAGVGGKLSIALGSFERDTYLLVQAIKQHRSAPLTSADLTTIASAVQLDQALAQMVRPNHHPNLRMRVMVSAGASSGAWLLMDGQAGVYYEFSKEGKPAFSQSAYFHQRDDLDSRLNKGIGQLRIGVDMAIARDRVPPEASDPTTTAPPLPSLDSPAMPVGSVLSVVARRAMSSLTAALDIGATLFPVPAIAPAAAVKVGETAKIVVTASVVGERYTLVRGDANVGEPVMGTGANLELTTDAITERTTFQVSVERVNAGIPVVRRVAVTVEVTS
ncbi:hypothetical protein ACNOYE_14565 [Nannocystaceae bacterium ST9]